MLSANCANGARVKDVTPEPRSQILMVLNQKEHGFPVRCGKFQALEALSGDCQAGRNVIHERDGLAGVVQQDRQIEQLGLVQLAEDAGVAFVPFGFGLPQAVQLFDGLEGVLVHRKTVRNIARRERVNPLQFRQKKSQETQRVHRAQRVRRMRFGQKIFQKPPKIAASRKAAGQLRPRQLQLLFGRRTEFEAALGHQPEGAKEKVRVGQALRLLKKNQPVHDGKILIGKARSPGFQLPVKERLSGGHFLEQLTGNVFDGARMGKVDAHPIGDIRRMDILRPNFPGRCIVLRIPGQKIVIPFIPEVQEATNGCEECQRRIHRGLVRGGKIFLWIGPAVLLFHGGHGGKPPRRDIVLKAARTILDIWLEVENGVRKLAVAVARQFRQALDQGL